MKNRKNEKRIFITILFVLSAFLCSCSNHISDITSGAQPQPVIPIIPESGDPTPEPATPEPTQPETPVPTPPAPSTFTVTCTSGEHGSITVDNTTAAAGTVITITVTPESGYMLDVLTATDSSGNTIAISISNTFTMPESDVTVNATFKVASVYYNITVVTGLLHGSISVNKTSATVSETVTITVTPDTGYMLNVLTVMDINGNILNISAGNTFAMPERNVTVYATFKVIPYTITCTSGGHGTISVDKTSAERFETVTITVTPEQGYLLDTLTATDSNGTNIFINTNTLSFYMPESNVTVNATFRAAQVILASWVNSTLNTSLHANSTATKFIHSITPPAQGITTYTLSDYYSDVDVLAWLDGTTIKFYAEGYTDSNRKIPLNVNSSMLFYQCTSLQEIDITYFDTTEVENMSGMFSNCENLETLTLPDGFDSSNVTDMSYMFHYCKKLTSLNLTSFNTSNVQNMQGMFSSCEELQTLTLSNSFNTSNVTDMSYMFQTCKKITSLNLTSFNTLNVTDMQGMFGGCEELQTLTLSNNFTTSNVTDMSYMFQTCKKLTSLNLTSFNTFNVTDMQSMFGGCELLTTIITGNGFITSNVTSSENMFSLCTSLTGSAGTAWNFYNPDNKTYARIDGGPNAPGYFTSGN